MVVGGRNFGCGSSPEHAPLALLGSGVHVVLAQSFARIVFRNAIKCRRFPVVCHDTDKIADGAKITLDLKKGYAEVDGNKSPLSRCPRSCRALLIPVVLWSMPEITGGAGMYKVAAIGGDGIGPEIVAEGKKVLESPASGSTLQSTGRISISGRTVTSRQKNS